MYILAHVAGGYLLALAWNHIMPRHQAHLWLAAGAGLLPDLIDKPISVFLPGWEHHTRGIGHTLLFLVLLAAATFRNMAGRGLVLGGATHLVLDSPWTYPETLWWPLLGPAFHRGDDFTYESIQEHLSKPVTAAAELIGGIVLMLALLHEVRQARRRRRETLREVTLE